MNHFVGVQAALAGQSPTRPWDVAFSAPPALPPLRHVLREAREKVWANAIVLSRARRQGPDAYARTLRQLEELSAAKVTALQAPGQVILKLATTGFGVRLPGAG